MMLLLQPPAISNMHQHDSIFQKQTYIQSIVDSGDTNILKGIPFKVEARKLEQRSGNI